ncbi:MAG: RNA polymerase sigma factor, partial [Gemmatimonadota bacterium]
VRGRPAVGSVDGAALRGERAFEDLLSANLDSLYRTALRLCRDPDDAQDLLQDAILRAFQRREQLRDFGAGRWWLFKILVRTHLNWVRAAKRRRVSVESDLDEGRFESALAAWALQEQGDDWLDRLAVRQNVRQAVEEIDPRFRVVLLLSDVEEFSQREVAAILDLPEGTVASRLFRARRALREILSRESPEAVKNDRKASEMT